MLAILLLLLIGQALQAGEPESEPAGSSLPARVTFRRLNRVEYNNTVRELLGVEMDAASEFPQDDSASGFDNMAESLTLSPLLMEKYLSAAEKISRAAVFGADVKSTTFRIEQPQPRRKPAYYSASDYDVSGWAQPGSLHLTHLFPGDGEYSFRIRTSDSRPDGSRPQQMALWVDGKIVRVFDAPEKSLVSGGKVTPLIEAQFKISAGQHEIVVAFPHMYEGMPANQTSRFDGMAVAVMDIVGPSEYIKKPSVESIRKIYVCDRRRSGCERTIVANLATRAFRRPVSQEEVDQLLEIVSNAQARGRSLQEGTALAIQGMLVSPDFLFRMEKDDSLSQYELASRLSYFLWSTMPDGELMRCARDGTLRHRAVLERQVRRMLADARSQALATNFSGQWLEVRRLEQVQPDRERFADWDDYLRSSMLKETELFFQQIVKEDRPILDFIDARWTFLDERLARHYRIPGVTGPEFRRVDLTGTGRAGLLTQGSVLTVSSYGNRTSPVLRGKWILENLLNTPPPPPPPNVRSLDEAATGVTASLRQQMEQHRRRPACASCHARMDQLGFALENYDAIGEWRTQDGNFPIDASGMLPDGNAFVGADGLEAVLKQNAAGFTQAMTAKLLSYALGRPVEATDRATIQKIAAGVAANHYRFSSLILGIVNSAPFEELKQ